MVCPSCKEVRAILKHGVCLKCWREGVVGKKPETSEPTVIATSMPEDWDARPVYCNLCGHDWVAVFDVNNTTRLECPACHGMSRINEIRGDQ